MTTKTTPTTDLEVGPPTTKPGAPSKTGSTAQTAKDQASAVASTAGNQASEVVSTARDQVATVAGTAKEQGGQVAAEAGQQARELLDQTYQQVSEQAQQQGARLAENLRTLSEELGRMAGSADDGSPARSVMNMLTHNTSRAAGYLEDKEPGQAIGDLSNFARRRPGAFLLGAAVAGFAAARVTKAARSGATPASGIETSDPYPVEEIPATSAALGATTPVPSTSGATP